MHAPCRHILPEDWPTSSLQWIKHCSKRWSWCWHHQLTEFPGLSLLMACMHAFQLVFSFHSTSQIPLPHPINVHNLDLLTRISLLLKSGMSIYLHQRPLIQGGVYSRYLESLVLISISMMFSKEGTNVQHSSKTRPYDPYQYSSWASMGT